MSVIEDINAERARQISKGYDAQHDDASHTHGELADAAIAYACAEPFDEYPPNAWPWDDEEWRPDGRRDNLIKAAALLVAEIERLDRDAAKPKLSPAALKMLAEIDPNLGPAGVGHNGLTFSYDEVNRIAERYCDEPVTFAYVPEPAPLPKATYGARSALISEQKLAGLKEVAEAMRTILPTLNGGQREIVHVALLRAGELLVLEKSA